MGDMFRSEEMAMAQLFLQPETAYYAVSELGEKGLVQFRDLNENVHVFQRRFVNEVRRCDEMERKLKYIEVEVRKDGVTIAELAELPRAPKPRDIIDLEAHLDKTETDIKDLNESSINLKTNFMELTQLKHVLEKSNSFFNEPIDVGIDSASQILILDDSHHNSGRGGLSYISGVINRARVSAFEIMLWRISRGNVFFRRSDIETPLIDPTTGNELIQSVFVIFFQGNELKNRITKVCTGFHATLYKHPDAPKERAQLLRNVCARLFDLDAVLHQTQEHRSRVLNNVAKELQNWSVMVSKMKAIYHNLNFFNVDVTKKYLIGECWIPVKDVCNVQKALEKGTRMSGSGMPSFLNIIATTEVPPTFNRTNKFTKVFQNLIDSYGVASYREINPALYTIVTFPFLFAVMFGDVGHAIFMLLFGLYMVVYEKQLTAKKSTSEIFNIFFAGRYIILLMGLFSMYTGLIYNDFFSKPMNIFGSRWSTNYTMTESLAEDYKDLNPTTDYVGTPYVHGLDPIWHLAENKIIFLNSFKMKLSIIFGVAHMIFGVSVSVINFVHFKKMSSIYLEFLPQMILLLALFLWMVVMMFLKWFMYGSAPEFGFYHGSYCSPLILIYFINMMLFKKPVPLRGCHPYLFGFQPTLQKILVFTALICIPWLLLGKPLYAMVQRHRKLNTHGSKNQDFELSEVTEKCFTSPDLIAEDVEEPLSEIFIHQAIHTIEYVLSTISHTASYLRLWALSLAHAQLSEVLWEMILHRGLVLPGFIGAVGTFLAFMVFAAFTISVLVTMEGLSAFLHTLRLHWVEFMSKFYEGLGYPFQPFSFQIILEAESDIDAE